MNMIALISVLTQSFKLIIDGFDIPEELVEFQTVGIGSGSNKKGDPKMSPKVTYVFLH